jgi:serine/threonine-protein kinase
VGIGTDLWVIDLERGGRTRLTFGQTARLFPFTWTADGRDIVFASPGTNRISRVPADGSGKPSVVLEGKQPQWPADTSPDGRVLAFYKNNASGCLRDLWTLPSAAGAAPTLFLGTPFQERSPRFSPDGRWIAYVSNESGRDEVYVRPYPGPGGQIAISTNGGTQPVWSRTTRELFFRSGTALMAVGFERGASLAPGAPRLLFQEEEFILEVGGPGGNPHYDVHPDGKRFLMLTGMPTPARAQVVLNWQEELKRLLPAE